MKRVIAIMIAMAVASPGVALAQSLSQHQPLADVAKAEEARRKTARKPAKVLTNDEPEARRAVEAPPPPATRRTPAPTPPQSEPAIQHSRRQAGAGGRPPQRTRPIGRAG